MHVLSLMEGRKDGRKERNEGGREGGREGRKKEKDGGMLIKSASVEVMYDLDLFTAQSSFLSEMYPVLRSYLLTER